MSFFLLICFLSFSWSKAINSQPVVSGQVVYEFRSKLNDVLINRDAVLQFRDGKSIFYHSRGEGIVCVDYLGNVGGVNMTVTTKNDNSGRMVLDCYNQDSIGNAYFIDFKERKLVCCEFVMVMSKYWWEEPLEKLQWKITNEKKKIGTYDCIKATVAFRGRQYVAWFTPMIPCPYGPWKLGQLPGLILEAHDESGEIVFLAKEIDIQSESNSLPEILPPSSAGAKHISYEKAKSIWVDEQVKWFKIANSLSERGKEHEMKSRKLMEYY